MIIFVPTCLHIFDVSVRMDIDQYVIKEVVDAYEYDCEE